MFIYLFVASPHPHWAGLTTDPYFQPKCGMSLSRKHGIGLTLAAVLKTMVKFRVVLLLAEAFLRHHFCL